MSRFTGTDTYVATDELMLAVNAALALERPLLVKGEPGTGKTMLAEEVARALDKPLYRWHIKSTTTPSSATTRCTTSPTTSIVACCGRRSNPTSRRWC
jgi:MoxR-like ATPase